MKGEMMIERSFDPSFPLALAAEDAKLVQEAASDDGEQPALPAAVERRLLQAEELGHGNQDMAAVYWAARGEPAGDR